MEEFHVNALNFKNCALLEDATLKGFLQKWSLIDGLHISAWAFNKSYHPVKIDSLVNSVISACHKISAGLPLVKLPVKVKPIACSVTDLNFFNKLWDPSQLIVYEGDGRIRGCMEEVVDGFIVANQLHQVLLNKDSATYSLYAEGERDELMFRILKYLVLGGEFCQYEDYLQPYIDVSLLFYKSFLNVQKDPTNGEVQIRNKCFRVIFPEGNNFRNFVYLIIDPGLREVVIFAHKY